MSQNLKIFLEIPAKEKRDHPACHQFTAQNRSRGVLAHIIGVLHICEGFVNAELHI